MKYLVTLMLIYLQHAAFGQTTHSVTVHVNQPAKCTVVSLEEIQPEMPDIYPNPARDVLQIKNITSGSRIELYDALGRIATSEISNANSMSLDVHWLRRGVYNVIIRHGKKVNTARIALQ